MGHGEPQGRTEVKKHKYVPGKFDSVIVAMIILSLVGAVCVDVGAAAVAISFGGSLLASAGCSVFTFPFVSIAFFGFFDHIYFEKEDLDV
jgi:hypothetical protein